MSPIRTRFAPSPTGKLHLGHILAARVARSLSHPDGEFLLRHEDIDGTRVREDFYREIESDLSWLGLIWDGEALRQTSRLAAYDRAFQKLRSMGVLYPCFCTRREIQEELARMAHAPHDREHTVYPGTCRTLDEKSRIAKIAGGQSHAWRLNAGAAAALTGPLMFQDLRHGAITVDPFLLGDVVLARKDIGVAYHLAVVVDDHFQKITHVTRGEDLLASTHVHRHLQALLDLPEPIYLHHELLMDADGKRLAKRDESCSIHHLRNSGLNPEQILALTDGAVRHSLLPVSQR